MNEPILDKFLTKGCTISLSLIPELHPGYECQANYCCCQQSNLAGSDETISTICWGNGE